MGIKDYRIMWRSQDERDDPENSPEYGIYLWEDPVNTLYWFSHMPVIDLGCDKEWDDAGIIACCTMDLKTIWVPWDSNEASKLQMSNALFYEKEMRVRAEAKLSQWQVWWQANGRNTFSELPPGVPPPPPVPVPAPASPPPLPAPAFPPTPPLPPPAVPTDDVEGRVARGPRPPAYPPPGKKAAVPKPSASPIAAPIAAVPKPHGAEASSGSGAPPTGPHVANPQGELNTGWKGKMCALLGAMEMNLPTRVAYLKQKCLVKSCVNKMFEPMLATITCALCERNYVLCLHDVNL